MPRFLPNGPQERFLDSAEWALDANTSRGTGRSSVMAFVAVKMAVQGATVHMYDPSLVLTHGTKYSSHRHFARLVMETAAIYFPDFEFQIHNIQNTLRCLGPRIRFTPIVADPEPAVKEFDDDGSEENT